MNSKVFTLEYIVLTVFVGLMGACSTATVRVMPGEDVSRVVARDHERDDAEEAAVDGANKYCKDKGKEAIFVSDKTQYTGEMDESTRNTVRTASTAAMILGGAGAVPRETRTGGALLGTAGFVGHTMTNGKDYEAEVKFRCK